MFLQEFDNNHNVFLVAREDDGYSVSTSLVYAIQKNLDLQLRYTYTDHESNIFLYEYDRNVVSTGLVYKF